MLVPFGTRVVDKNGKGVGTVSRLVLDSKSREVVSLVVHHGVLNRRQVEVPISKVADFGEEVRLSLRAAEFNELDPFDEPNFRVMPDHWDMPIGFDQRDFFLVGGSAWSESVLPFEPTSPDVSGTPRYVRDPDAPQEPPEPDIAAGAHVYDKTGQRIGEVEGVEFDEASRRIIRVTVRHGIVFHTETAIPASLIASAGERITLNVGAEAVKKLERG
jgi:sporulation protein YlmC with PRC-barrel domain